MLWGGIKFRMVIYATPNATQMEDIFQIFKFSNEAAGGTMFIAIMGVIWSISLIGSLANGSKFYRGFIYSNFICSVLSMILGLLGVLTMSYMYFFILLLAFGVLWAKLVDGKP